MVGSKTPFKAVINKKTITLMIALLLAVIIIVIWHNLAGSSEGTITESSAKAEGKTTTVKFIAHKGKYISFSYPENFRSLATQKPANAVLESADYTSGGFPSAELSLVVFDFPSGNLKDSPSYLLRSQKPEQYKLDSWPILGSDVPVFSDYTVAYSKVAFMTHGGKLLTVSYSGGGDAQKAEQQQKAVLNSVRWQ